MHSPDPELANANLEEMRKVGYDTRDIDLGQITKSVMGFFIFTVFCIVAGLGPVWYYGHWGYKDTPARLKAPLAIKDAPLVQSNVTAKRDIRTLRQEELVHLTTYGWVDKEKGIVRIPVEVALQMALERGFPERTGVAESAISEPTPDMSMPSQPPTGNPDTPVSSDGTTGPTSETPPTTDTGVTEEGKTNG